MPARPRTNRLSDRLSRRMAHLRIACPAPPLPRIRKSIARSGPTAEGEPDRVWGVRWPEEGRGYRGIAARSIPAPRRSAPLALHGWTSLQFVSARTRRLGEDQDGVVTITRCSSCFRRSSPRSRRGSGRSRARSSRRRLAQRPLRPNARAGDGGWGMGIHVETAPTPPGVRDRPLRAQPFRRRRPTPCPRRVATSPPLSNSER
jgi:hypothetical protein